MRAGTGNARKAMMNIEYTVVLIVFIMFCIYFTFRMMEQKPAYVREVRKETFRSENFMLAEVLVNDPGQPTDWDTRLGQPGTIRRIGLSDHTENVTNLLSSAKVAGLAALCGQPGGYDIVAAKLGSTHNFTINVTDMYSDATVAYCGPTPPHTGDVFASVKRMVAFEDGSYGEILVRSW